MKLLANLIAIFSSRMRSTLELERLNRIWEKFNNKEISNEETQIMLLKNKWVHHTEKAKLLLDFTLIANHHDKNT